MTVGAGLPSLPVRSLVVGAGVLGPPRQLSFKYEGSWTLLILALDISLNSRIIGKSHV